MNLYQHLDVVYIRSGSKGRETAWALQAFLAEICVSQGPRILATLSSKVGLQGG